MKRLLFWLLAAVLCLGVGLVISCSGGGDDDDDDDTGDDDTGDDDTGDDDTGDDDTGDTWTDPSSGLTWQVTPTSDSLTWDEAKTYCNNLSSDGGGWHLPTISELRTLIRGCDGTVTGGSCGVTDDCLDYSCQDESCYACNPGDGPNDGCYGPSEVSGDCNWYWSSSPVADSAVLAWAVNFDGGFVSHNGDADSHAFTRCVR